MNIFCFSPVLRRFISFYSPKMQPIQAIVKNTKLPEGFCRKENYIISITTSKQENNSILDIVSCTKKEKKKFDHHRRRQ